MTPLLRNECVVLCDENLNCAPIFNMMSVHGDSPDRSGYPATSVGHFQRPENKRLCEEYERRAGNSS